ncbi:MAG TPA: hypothetical protein VI565_04040 [Burkholderiales bacterium]|nr:hypothetical protein [Burkholderiales bacterium]
MKAIKPKYCAGLLFIALTGVAAPALATECTVNVHNAYLTAKNRGWNFNCKLRVGSGASAAIGTLGPVQAKFASYPPDKIGCSVATPPVVPPGVFILGYFFGNTGVSTGGGKALRNGWSVDRYEVSGKQYSTLTPTGDWASYGSNRILFKTTDLSPNNSYNVKLSKLVLKKSNGNCAKAIDEAF